MPAASLLHLARPILGEDSANPKTTRAVLGSRRIIQEAGSSVNLLRRHHLLLALHSQPNLGLVPVILVAVSLAQNPQPMVAFLGKATLLPHLSKAVVSSVPQEEPRVGLVQALGLGRDSAPEALCSVTTSSSSNNNSRSHSHLGQQLPPLEGSGAAILGLALLIILRTLVVVYLGILVRPTLALDKLSSSQRNKIHLAVLGLKIKTRLTTSQLSEGLVHSSNKIRNQVEFSVTRTPTTLEEVGCLEI